MDPYIISRTPNASPILAYGTARGPGWNPKLLALVAGSLAIVLIVIVSLFVTQTTVEVPKQRLVTVVVTPRRIASALPPTLVRDLAAPWRAAIESRSRFPAVLGASLMTDGSIRHFAIVSRTAAVGTSPAVHVTPDGALLRLTSSLETDSEVERVSLKDAFRGALKKRDASFSFRADLLSAVGRMDNGSTEDQMVRGSWTGRMGVLDIASDEAQATGAVAGPLFAVLGSDAAVARPAVTGLLSQGFDLRDLTQMPQTIAIDPAAEGSVALSWDGVPDGDNANILAAVQGRTTKEDVELPDLGVFQEIVRGNAFPSTGSGPTLVFLGPGLASSSFDIPSSPPPACPGNLRFLLKNEPLRQVLLSLNLPESWIQALQEVRVTESEGKVRVCI